MPVNEFAHGATGKPEYVALKVLKIGVDEDGQAIYRDVGEPVPEAKDWPASAVAALLHTNQIGQGPALDTHVEVQQLRKDVEKLRDRVEALSTERSALRDQLATEKARADELELKLAPPKQSQQDADTEAKGKTFKLPAPPSAQKAKE